MPHINAAQRCASLGTVLSEVVRANQERGKQQQQQQVPLDFLAARFRRYQKGVSEGKFSLN